MSLAPFCAAGTILSEMARSSENSTSESTAAGARKVWGLAIESIGESLSTFSHVHIFSLRASCLKSLSHEPVT